MKLSATRFLFSVLSITIICALLLLIWNKQMPETMQFNDGFIVLGFFALVVTAVHLFLLKLSQKEPKVFIRGFMVSIAVKFLLYLAMLSALLLYSKDNKKVLVLHFLFYYAVFTVLEVSMLYKQMRKMKGKQAIGVGS